MEFYPQLDGYVLVAVTWDNCDMGPTQPSLIVARATELGDLALIRDYKFSAYGEEHLALYVREVREFVRCTACGEVVEAIEPCSCVFNVVGTLDAQGVLHTAHRVRGCDDPDDHRLPGHVWCERHGWSLIAASGGCDDCEGEKAFHAWQVKQWEAGLGPHPDWTDEDLI